MDVLDDHAAGNGSNFLEHALDYIRDVKRGQKGTRLHLPRRQQNLAFIAGVLVGAASELEKVASDPKRQEAAQVLAQTAMTIAALRVVNEEAEGGDSPRSAHAGE